MALDNLNSLKTITKSRRHVSKQGSNRNKGTNELLPVLDLVTALNGNSSAVPTPIGEAVLGAIAANQVIVLERGIYAEVLAGAINPQDNIQIMGGDVYDQGQTVIDTAVTIGNKARFVAGGFTFKSLDFVCTGAPTTNHKFEKGGVNTTTTFTDLPSGFVEFNQYFFKGDIDFAGLAAGTTVYFNFCSFQNGAKIINQPAGTTIILNDCDGIDLSSYSLPAGAKLIAKGGRVNNLPADLSSQLLASGAVIDFERVDFISDAGTLLQPAITGTLTSWLRHCTVANPSSNVYNNWTKTDFSVHASGSSMKNKLYTDATAATESVATILTSMTYVPVANDRLRIRNLSTTATKEVTATAFTSFEQLNDATATSLFIPPLTTIELVFSGTTDTYELANVFGQQGLAIEEVVSANTNLAALVADLEIGDTVYVRATTPVTITAAGAETVNNWDAFVGHTATVYPVKKLAAFLKTGANSYTLVANLSVAQIVSNTKNFAATTVFQYTDLVQCFSGDVVADAALMTEEFGYLISNRDAAVHSYTFNNVTDVIGAPAQFDATTKMLYLEPGESVVVTKYTNGASVVLSFQG